MSPTFQTGIGSTLSPSRGTSIHTANGLDFMRKIILFSISALICLLLCRGSLHANLIVDGGFETPVLAPGTGVLFSPGSTFGGPGGWLALGDPGLGPQIGILRSEASEPGNGVTAFNAHSGFNSTDLTGVYNRGPSLGIQQSLTTAIGQAYTLSFYVGTVTPTFGPNAQSFYHDPATIDVSINAATRLHFTNNNRTNGFINWQQFSVGFTATSGTTTIAFLNGTMPILFGTAFDVWR